MSEETKTNDPRKRPPAWAILIAVVVVVIIMLVALRMYRTQQSEPIPTQASVEQSQFLQPPDDLRGFRYCELRQVFRDGLTLRIEVYTTMGLSDCPGDIWTTLDADALTEENGAMGVQLNGPRYWVLNSIVGNNDTSNPEVFDFGGLEMIQAVQLEIPVLEATSLQGNYNPNEVQGNATFVYKAGNRVYELVSPERDVYRMQSYSQGIDPSLTLENLGDQLDLPDDWQFQTSVLTEDSEVSSTDTTVVVQDELGNSYVKVNP